MSRRLTLSRLDPRSERGAAAVVIAVTLIAMFTLVALVIDIAAVRADARTNQ
jgi:hypothetical protein